MSRNLQEKLRTTLILIGIADAAANRTLPLKSHLVFSECFLLIVFSARCLSTTISPSSLILYTPMCAVRDIHQEIVIIANIEKNKMKWYVVAKYRR